MTEKNSYMKQLSDGLSDAVATASTYTVTVDARHRFPASGFAYSTDLVITANHVVANDSNIHITLPDASVVEGTLVGRDPGRDLALIRIEQPKLTPPVMAGGKPRVGQLALALGRPDENGVQASLGIVTSVGGPVRTGHGSMLSQYLQTDTIAYPGFSGGPLVDVEGHLLGLNTSALSQGNLITIPTEVAWEAAAVLLRLGHIPHGYLGIRSQVVKLAENQQGEIKRKQETGLLLVGIEDDSPSVKAGLVVSDILVGLGGQPVVDSDSLQILLTGDHVGKTLIAEILRGGMRVEVQITIGERS